jgi:hypothetical protein
MKTKKPPLPLIRRVSDWPNSTMMEITDSMCKENATIAKAIFKDENDEPVFAVVFLRGGNIKRALMSLEIAEEVNPYTGGNG